MAAEPVDVDMAPAPAASSRWRRRDAARADAADARKTPALASVGTPPESRRVWVPAVQQPFVGEKAGSVGRSTGAEDSLTSDRRETNRAPHPKAEGGIAGARSDDERDSHATSLIPPETQAADQVRQKVPQDPCPVCMEGFGSADPDGLAKGLPRTCRRCHASFHQACLAEWAKKEQQLKLEQKPWLLPATIESGSCPMCRATTGHDRSRRWTKNDFHGAHR